MLNRLFGATQQESSPHVEIDIEMGLGAAGDVTTADNRRHLLDVGAKEIDTSLWRVFSEAPRPLFDEFTKSFLEGAALQFLTSLSEDALKKYGCTQTQISRVTFAIDMLFALYTGSLLSTSAENATLFAMKYFKYSDDSAFITSKIAGTTVNIAQNFSPLGVAKVVVSSGAGYAGGKFTIWSKEKISSGIASLTYTKSKEPEPTLTSIVIV